MATHSDTEQDERIKRMASDMINGTWDNRKGNNEFFCLTQTEYENVMEICYYIGSLISPRDAYHVVELFKIVSDESKAMGIASCAAPQWMPGPPPEGVLALVEVRKDHYDVCARDTHGLDSVVAADKDWRWNPSTILRHAIINTAKEE